MSSTVELMDKNKTKITVNVSAEQLEEAIVKAYHKIKNQVNIPGFRKGKAPRKMIEVAYGIGIFYEEAIDILLPELYRSAVDEHKLEPVSRPDIDVKSISKENGAVIECEIYTKPKAEVSEYKGFSYKATSTEVTEDDIAAELAKAREKNSRIVTITDRPVQNGDIAVIDFEGFIDGVAFEGGKGENHELTIGSQSFIAGFEEQLIGKTIGEECDVNVSFPEDYRAEQLAGKPAVFKCRINEIKQKELPELDDDFAQDVSEFDTLDEYKSDIKAKLEEENTRQAEIDRERQLIDALLEKTSVDVPEPMIETQIDNMVADFEKQIAGTGIPFEAYLGYMQTDVEGLRKNYRVGAERNVKARLALEAIAELEAYEPTDEDVDKELTLMAEQYGLELEKLKNIMRKSDLDGIKHDIQVQKALDIVVNSASAE